MAALNIYDTTKWFRTRKKVHESYVCKPPLGTRVYNKLTHNYEITQIGREYVVSGASGEQFVVGYTQLSNYTRYNGQPLTRDYLDKNGTTTKLNNANWVKIVHRVENLVYWAYQVDVSYRNAEITLPNGKRLLVNRTGMAHNGGDYLVCRDYGNGHPNFEYIEVVHGLVFQRSFDMRSSTTERTASGKSSVPVPKGITQKP